MRSQIHPSVVIEGDVDIGAGVVVGPFSHLRGPLTIGPDAWIGSHCAVGVPAHHSNGAYERADAPGPVILEAGVVLREFGLVQQATRRETRVGAGSYIMGHVTISHDATIGHDVVIGNHVALGQKLADNLWVLSA